LRSCAGGGVLPAPRCRAEESRVPHAPREGRLVVVLVGHVLAAHGLVDLVPVRRDLLHGAGRRQCSFLQPEVHPFNVFELSLEFADPLTEGADFLRDRLEVFQSSGEYPLLGLALVKPAAAPRTTRRVASCPARHCGKGSTRFSGFDTAPSLCERPCCDHLLEPISSSG
jgi:hypothetical protein